MELNLFKKNMQKREEKLFEEYLKEKMPAIEQLLTKFADDAALLRVSVEKFEKHDAYEVEFCLVLPSKTILAKEASHQITKAIDLSKDRLVSQIKKHMDHLRKNRSHESIRKEEPKKVEVESFIL